MILNLSPSYGKKGGDELLEKDSLKTIKSFCTFESKTQKSRFVALAYPFSNPDEFSSVQAKVKKEFYDSAHIPFAYRAGLENDRFRFNDDGEPSGSAGKPILDAIDKYDIVLVHIEANSTFVIVLTWLTRNAGTRHMKKVEMKVRPADRTE